MASQLELETLRQMAAQQAQDALIQQQTALQQQALQQQLVQQQQEQQAIALQQQQLAIAQQQQQATAQQPSIRTSAQQRVASIRPSAVPVVTTTSAQTQAQQQPTAEQQQPPQNPFAVNPAANNVINTDSRNDSLFLAEGWLSEWDNLLHPIRPTEILGDAAFWQARGVFHVNDAGAKYWRQLWYREQFTMLHIPLNERDVWIGAMPVHYMIRVRDIVEFDNLLIPDGTGFRIAVVIIYIPAEKRWQLGFRYPLLTEIPETGFPQFDFQNSGNFRNRAVAESIRRTRAYYESRAASPIEATLAWTKAVLDYISQLYNTYNALLQNSAFASSFASETGSFAKAAHLRLLIEQAEQERLGISQYEVEDVLPAEELGVPIGGGPEGALALANRAAQQTQHNFPFRPFEIRYDGPASRGWFLMRLPDDQPETKYSIFVVHIANRAAAFLMATPNTDSNPDATWDTFRGNGAVLVEFREYTARVQLWVTTNMASFERVAILNDRYDRAVQRLMQAWESSIWVPFLDEAADLQARQRSRAERSLYR